MAAGTWLEDLRKTSDVKDVLPEVLARPERIDDLLSVAATDPTSLKFRCMKLVRLVSEQRPILVLPSFDTVAALLHSSNHFVLWDAILILANLAAVDREHRFDAVYETYFALLRAPDMVTAANVAGHAWQIIAARPDLEPDISSRLLTVPTVVFLHKGQPSPECSRVVCGHLIATFDRYYAVSSCQSAIRAFVQTQLLSSRRAVVRQAEAFLKRHP